MKLITPQRAKEEVKRLQEYIDLVESYQADTLEKWIVKEYAFTNSMIEVVRRANHRGLTNNGSPIDQKFVVSVINSNKVNDELHRLLRLGYRQKIRSCKVRY